MINRIRTGLVSLLVVLLSGSANSQSTPVRSPVGVMYSLYTGCMKAYFQANEITETTKPALSKMLDQLDDNCLTWMVIWYQPLMGVSIDKAPDGSIARFTEMHQRTMVNTYQELIAIHNIKK